MRPSVNLPDTFTKTQCVEKKCPRTIPYSAFCKSQSHAKVERAYWAADEVLEELRARHPERTVHPAADFLERRFSGEGAS